MSPSSAKSTSPASTQAMARYDDLEHRLAHTHDLRNPTVLTSNPSTGRPRQAPQHSKLETRLHHGDCAHRDPTIHGRSRQQEAAAASRGHQLLSKRTCGETCVDREGTRNWSSQTKRAACSCLDAAAAAATYDDNDFFGLQHSIGATCGAETRGIHSNAVLLLIL